MIHTVAGIGLRKNKRSFNDQYLCYLFPRMNTRYVCVYARTTYNAVQYAAKGRAIWRLHCTLYK